MRRRHFLGLLGSAAALVTVSPRLLFAAKNAHDLAIEGQELLAAGNMDKALEVLLEGRRIDPRNDRVHALLGRLFFKRGDARRALEEFRLAVRLNPEDTVSRIMAETIEQFPLPPPTPQSGQVAASGAGVDRTRRAPSRQSALEREAQAERDALLEQGKAGRQAGPFRLLVDPGHGGADAGSDAFGLRESDVALDVSLRMARILAGDKDTINVSLTRVADSGLPGWARAGLAGWYGADALLSIHAAKISEIHASGLAVCALGQTASGPVASAIAAVENAAYGREDTDGDQGAGALFVRAARRAAATGYWRRGVELAGMVRNAWPKSAPLPVMPLQTAPLRLLAEAAAPAMLVEVGFLSNQGDAAVLGVADKRQALAQSLAQAVLAMVRQASPSGE